MIDFPYEDDDLVIEDDEPEIPDPIAEDELLNQVWEIIDDTAKSRKVEKLVNAYTTNKIILELGKVDDHAVYEYEDGSRVGVLVRLNQLKSYRKEPENKL